MPAPSLPSSKSVTPSRKRGTKKSTASTRARSRSMTARTKQVTAVAISGSEILGSGAAASALYGWRKAKGESYSIGPVDLRIIGGLGALLFGLWKSGKTNQHAVNIGTGILTSWTNQRAEDFGRKMAEGKEEESEKGSEKESTTTAEPTETPGVVVGYVDESGRLSKSKERRLARIERRLARLQGRKAKVEAKLGRGSAGSGRRQIQQQFQVPPGYVLVPKQRMQRLRQRAGGPFRGRRAY